MSELTWFKSSHSGSQGDDCVEVAVSWRQSATAEAVRIRDSKHQHGPQLALSPTAWNDFVSHTAHA